MSIKLGSTGIEKVYLGSTEIKKAYLGSALIYDKTSSGFDVDFQAWLDRLTFLGYGLPSAGQQTNLNQLVLNAKSNGWWTPADAIYPFAIDSDRDAAKVNLKAPTLFESTEVNAPTWTANQGFTGNATNAYLDSGFNPTTATTPNFTLNDAHVSMWVRTARSAGGTTSADIGYAGSNTGIRVRSIVNTQRFNSGNTSSIDLTGTGLIAANKPATAQEEFFRDLTQISQTASDIPLQNSTITFLGSGAAGGTNIQGSFGIIGASMVAEHPDIRADINTYMNTL